MATSATTQSGCEGEPFVRENSVCSLQQNPFAKRSLEGKKRVKEFGPDRPDLLRQQKSGDRGRSYVNRAFSRNVYEKRSWLMGCNVKNAFLVFFLGCFLIVNEPTQCGHQQVLVT